MLFTDPLIIDLAAVLAPPSAVHWLGADDLGRDVLARVVAGVGASLTVGFGVLLLTALVGIPLGLAAGWWGGWVERVAGKVSEVVLSFPGLLLALALTALLGPSLLNVVVALGLLGWVGFYRLTRVQVQRLRGLAFVRAAELAGVGTVRIWLRHILPNCAGPLQVEALLMVAGAMVAEAGLSFLGLGIPAPYPSLGGMLRDGMRFMLVAPWLVVIPAVVLIGLTVLVNLAAKVLRQRWDNAMQGGR
ncbi:MAG: ABC transporter permease [Proteobacteria bacterium]|nr:ABC transporter permease [Pseudomonadota bacterium]